MSSQYVNPHASVGPMATQAATSTSAVPRVFNHGDSVPVVGSTLSVVNAHR